MQFAEQCRQYGCRRDHPGLASDRTWPRGRFSRATLTGCPVHPAGGTARQRGIHIRTREGMRRLEAVSATSVSTGLCTGIEPLLTGKAKFMLPGNVGVDDLPIALCDVLGIEGAARHDLSGDRERRHPDAILLQIGSEHGGGGTKCCFPERNGREGWDRMVCKAATRHDDGAGAGRPHGWGDNLRHDDGADDVNRVGRLQVLDARIQERVRSAHDRVVDDETRRILAVVELSQPRSQGFRIAGIRRHGVDSGSGVCQAVCEIAESVRVSSQQGHLIAAGGEATSHSHSETRPGTDQKKVTMVDRGAGVAC